MHAVSPALTSLLHPTHTLSRHVCCTPLCVVQVDKHLRVVSHPSLFAVGDVTDVPEEKLAFLAAEQGQMVAASLAKLVAAANQMQGASRAVEAAGRQLGVWKPSKGVPVMFVSIGRK